MRFPQRITRCRNYLSMMYWSFLFWIIFLNAPAAEGQRRAAVHYPVTSTEESEPVSENPLSSSINSIQTGREELLAFHRGDAGINGGFRRSFPKTTTPDYFKEPNSKGDTTSTEKTRNSQPARPLKDDSEVAASVSRNRNDGNIKAAETYGAATDPQDAKDTLLFKDKRSSGSESTLSSTVRPDTFASRDDHLNSEKPLRPVHTNVETSERDLAETGRTFSRNGEVDESMDTNKTTFSRDHDRRSNTRESRRQTTTPSSSSSGRFKEGTERHREDISAKNYHETSNREITPNVSVEHSRAQRSSMKSISDKDQIVTYTSTTRIPTAERYDRVEQPLISDSSPGRKAPDNRDSSRGIDEKKDLQRESDPHSVVYQTENGRETMLRGDRSNSSDFKKPTHLPIGEEGPVESSKHSEIYGDEFRSGGKDDMNEKIGSDTGKSSGGGDGRPYVSDDVERSSEQHGRDMERGSRRHRDRYDDRSYDERLPKGSQSHRNRERTTAYSSQTPSRSSRPRDGRYDDEYGDEGYLRRDVTKDVANIPTDRTRLGRPRETRIDDDVKDRYTSDATRSYKDYPDDPRYREERVPTNRDTSRRHRDDGNRKHRDDSRTYDEYEDTLKYRDDYDRRYGDDTGSKRFEDTGTRRYGSSGSHRYGTEETRRTQTEYDRPTRRYDGDDEYNYNSTQRRRDNYEGYIDDGRRSSGESGSSQRYDGSRYDDEQYKGSRSYSSRDNDRKYTVSNNEGSSSQRSAGRRYVTDDGTRYREDDDERRYRDETRIYVEGSLKDRYDQDYRRTYGDEGSSSYIGTHPYQERSETSVRRDRDDLNRSKELNDSRRFRGDESYRSNPYDEDEYYNNRTSTAYIDRYDESDQSRRRTDEFSGLPATDGDDRRYVGRSNDERKRDRDKVYTDIPVNRRRGDTDETRRDTSKVYDEDYRNDRRRGDTYDDRTYRRRDDDEYTRSSRDRAKDYDTRFDRDSDDELDTRNYRVTGEGDANDRYRGDGIKDRNAEDESRSVNSRNKDYVERRYDEGYRYKNSDGTYSYRDEDERYSYTSSEDRKLEHRDPERRSRQPQRIPNDEDSRYARDSNIPRSTDESRRSEGRSNKREDRLTSDRTDVDGRAPDKTPIKTDKSSRGDTKLELPISRNEDSLLKGESSSPYDNERRSDGRRSHTRDTQPDSRISRTDYSSRSDNVPQKTRTSDEERPSSLDKADFARGRRTSIFSEDDRTDSDRDEGGRITRDERYPQRTVGNEESSYARNEKDQGSNYDTRNLRQSDKFNLRSNSEGHILSSRNSDTSRRKIKDEIPVSRMPTDALPTAEDADYTERTDNGKQTSSQNTDETQRRGYSSTSTLDRGSRRRLPSSREAEIDKSTRRDESDYKSEDSTLSEGRGRYRYTKSRGDREDFPRHAEEGLVTGSDEYTSTGTSSKVHDPDRRDMLKGEYGSPGSGTPTRIKEDTIATDAEKEEFPSSREKLPSRSGKSVDDVQTHRDFDRRENVSRDRDDTSRDSTGIYDNSEYPPSSSQDDSKFRFENTTREHFESSSREAHVDKEVDHITLTVSQPVSSGRTQGSTISRSATPIPHYQEKELKSRSTSNKTNTDRITGIVVNREKRYQYDDRPRINNTSRNIMGMNDEQSRRPLTTKEVIEAAYRHSDELEKQSEIYYPVYVPSSSNMTSPDVIRPSERRGITTPTKKKKKK